MSVASKLSSRPRAFAPLDYALYAAAVQVWGLSGTALHYQVGEVAPEVSIVWRFAIAAPLMLAFAAWRGERLVFGLADHAHFAALGAAIFSTNYALFYYAGLTIASGLLSIVFSLAAFGFVVLGNLIFGTRIEGRVLVGVACGSKAACAAASRCRSAAHCASASATCCRFRRSAKACRCSPPSAGAWSMASWLWRWLRCCAANASPSSGARPISAGSCICRCWARSLRSASISRCSAASAQRAPDTRR